MGEPCYIESKHGTDKVATWDFDTEIKNVKLHQEVSDYVMHMFGVPAIKLELDESHLDLVVKSSDQFIKAYIHPTFIDSNFKIYKELLKSGALAKATIILGHIRGKYGVKCVYNESTLLKPETIYEYGQDMLRTWEESVHKFAGTIY